MHEDCGQPCDVPDLTFIGKCYKVSPGFPIYVTLPFLHISIPLTKSFAETQGASLRVAVSPLQRLPQPDPPILPGVRQGTDPARRPAPAQLHALPGPVRTHERVGFADMRILPFTVYMFILSVIILPQSWYLYESIIN